VTQTTAADQCASVNAQLSQALMRQDALRRELKTCEENVLALTSISAGIQLGKQAAQEVVKAPPAELSPK
jgi:hypothetical protein